MLEVPTCTVIAFRRHPTSLQGSSSLVLRENNYEHSFPPSGFSLPPILIAAHLWCEETLLSDAVDKVKIKYPMAFKCQPTSQPLYRLALLCRPDLRLLNSTASLCYFRRRLLQSLSIIFAAGHNLQAKSFLVAKDC